MATKTYSASTGKEAERLLRTVYPDLYIHEDAWGDITIRTTNDGNALVYDERGKAASLKKALATSEAQAALRELNEGPLPPERKSGSYSGPAFLLVHEALNKVTCNTWKEVLQYLKDFYATKVEEGYDHEEAVSATEDWEIYGISERYYSEAEPSKSVNINFTL